QEHRLRAANGPGCVQPWFLRRPKRHIGLYGSSLAVALRTTQFRRSQVIRRGGRKPGKSAKPKSSKVSASPVAVAQYPDKDVFALDVECLAIGRTHEKSDRAPCSYAVVDGFGKLLKRTLIRPPREVVSYLTPFTGLRDGDITAQNSLSFERAVRELREVLPRRAILVGQEPSGDIEWMELRQGQEYKQCPH
ncbi:Atp13a1, partial [Symbiodinium microadriaticum]